MDDFISDKEFTPDQQISAQRQPASEGQSFIPDSEFISDEAKYGEGIGNEAKAFGAGAARAASFGASDYLLTKSGLANPETLKGLEEQNPTASTLGEITGIAGSLVAAPEGLLVGRLGKAADVISESAGAIASKAAPLLANPETAPLANKVLQAVGQVGARALGGAAEGAAFGVGRSISDQAMGDPDLNGQKLIANIGYSALFGGALSSALKVGEIAIPKSIEAAKNSFNKLYDVSVGLPGEEPGVLSKAYARSASFVSGKPYEQIIEGLQNRVKSLVNPDEQQALVKDFAEGLQDQHKKVNSALYEANSKARLQETSSYLKDISGDVALPEFTKITSELKNNIREMRSEPDLYPASYPRILEQIEARVVKEVTTDSTSFDIFKTLDDLKKRLDEEIDYGAMPSGGDLRAQNQIETLRRGIKGSLENEDVWGSAAARQAAFNDAQSQLLNITGKKGIFRKDFMAPTLSKGGKQIYEISPQKIKTYLSQINDLRGEAKSQSLTRYMEASENLVNEIENTYRVLPEQNFNKDQIQNLIGKNKEFSQKAAEQSEYNKALNALGAGAHNVPIAEGGAIASAALGHPIIGAALETANLMKAPGLAIQRLAKVEKLISRTSNAIETGVSSMFKSAAKAVEPFTGYLGTKLSGEEREKKYNKITLQINELQNNPEKFINVINDKTKDLYAHAPNITQGVINSVARANTFLASKIPQEPEKALLSEPYKPSEAEMSYFERYLKTVEDPLSTLNEMKSGMLTKESIETLTQVYPELYQEMKTQVISKISDHMAKSKKEPLSYGTKLSLSMFLNVDLDNSLRQNNIATNQIALAGMQSDKDQADQQMMNKTPQKQSTVTGLGKLDISNRSKTAMQSVTQRNMS